MFRYSEIPTKKTATNSKTVQCSVTIKFSRTQTINVIRFYSMNVKSHIHKKTELDQYVLIKR